MTLDCADASSGANDMLRALVVLLVAAAAHPAAGLTLWTRTPALGLARTPLVRTPPPPLALAYVDTGPGDGDDDVFLSTSSTREEVVSEVASLDAPDTVLEQQQRQVIEILVKRLGLDEIAGVAAIAPRKAIEMLQATGDDRMSVSLQDDLASVEADLREWDKRLMWATETVKQRDALSARLATVKGEVVAAEEALAPLKAECEALEREQRKAAEARVDAARAAAV